MVNQAAMDSIRARISANIADHGWHVTAVGEDPRSGAPTFAYSIGMTETLRHPELLMIGMAPSLAQRLINDVGRLVREGERFGDWDRSDRVIRDLPVVFRLVPKAESREWARGASERYRMRGGFELLQVFLPDARGTFPWDDDHDPSWAKGQGRLLGSMRPKLSS